jgi:hypothetical protein
MDCGWNDPDLPEALEFDHRDPAMKSFGIAREAAKRSWQEIEAEITKCDVVCAICHRRRTKVRREEGKNARTCA